MGNRMSSPDRTLNMDSVSDILIFRNGTATNAYSQLAASTMDKCQPNSDAEEDFEILDHLSSSMERIGEAGEASIVPEDIAKCSCDLLHILDTNTWQNPNSDVLFLTESLVMRYLESVLHFMKLMHEEWDLRLIKCGAFYEGLSTGLPIQLEYMLELSTVQVSEVTRLTATEEEDSVDKLAARFCYMSKGLTEGSVEYASVIEQIITCMKRYMYQNCYFNDLQLLEVQDSQDCPPGLLLFIRHKDHGIRVNLVPAVKFPPYCRDVLPPFPEDILNFISMIIPGLDGKEDETKEFITRHLHLVFSDFPSRYRISSAVLEMYIMKCLPEKFKQPFRVLMYLCQTHLVLPESYHSNYLQRSVMLKLFGYKPFLPSYAIKLLFLNHMVEYYSQTNGSPSPGMYHSDKTGLIQTLIKDLKRLKYFIYLPVDCCAFMVSSIVFGDAYRHRFNFVQKLVYSGISKNIGWFDRMVNTIELILDEEISKEEEAAYKRRFKKLNYPTLTNVQFYPRFF